MKRIDVQDKVDAALMLALQQGRIIAKVDDQGRTYYVAAPKN